MAAAGPQLHMGSAYCLTRLCLSVEVYLPHWWDAPVTQVNKGGEGDYVNCMGKQDESISIPGRSRLNEGDGERRTYCRSTTIHKLKKRTPTKNGEQVLEEWVKQTMR